MRFRITNSPRVVLDDRGKRFRPSVVLKNEKTGFGKRVDTHPTSFETRGPALDAARLFIQHAPTRMRWGKFLADSEEVHKRERADYLAEAERQSGDAEKRWQEAREKEEAKRVAARKSAQIELETRHWSKRLYWRVRNWPCTRVWDDDWFTLATLRQLNDVERRDLRMYVTRLGGGKIPHRVAKSVILDQRTQRDVAEQFGLTSAKVQKIIRDTIRIRAFELRSGNNLCRKRLFPRSDAAKSEQPKR